MATLVLTAVGTLVGGPIGGAIGAIAGQAIDQEIFKPKGRRGPRLGELSVQTSSYGTAIPKIFGTMRAAGTVIWATDLREERRKSGGGKGRPSTTSYSYSASFAVLLSARPIRGVRRIWADGNLLRGAAGDFKSETGFRLHLGNENQTVDPLIASAEGIGVTPAYRGAAYQTGVQRARRPGPGRRSERIELPAVLGAGEAKAIAEARLARLWTERARRTVRVGWRRLGIRPGDCVAFEGETGRWRVSGWTLEHMVMALELVRSRVDSVLPPPEATPGRSVTAPDLVHGPTVVHLLDLPTLTDELAISPRLHVAAAGPSTGWRIAALAASIDGGASWEPIGATAPPTTMGAAAGVLGVADAALIDLANSVEVDLLNEAMLLADADEAALVAGANLALLGDELIQFGSAAPLGGGRWRLSRLARGRRGTEWAITEHVVGERFVLIEAETLATFDPPSSALGGEIRVMATGVGDAGDAGGVESAVAGLGEGLRPPSPVHLNARRRVDGGFDIDWIRRSRSGWRWIDGVDAPLGEEQERYRVTISPAAGAPRVVETTGPSFDYSAADAAADRVLGDSVTLSVAQSGTFATSRAATIVLSIEEPSP